MATEQKCYIIKSNKDKFVSDTRYNAQEILKFNWSTDPSEAKIYTEYPSECPSNSRIFTLIPDRFYKIVIEDSKPKIVQSDLKPFSSKEEFRDKQDAVENFIASNIQTIKNLKEKIVELEEYNNLSKDLLIDQKEDVLNIENSEFDKFKNKCQNKVLSFTISLWGTKYVDILGKTITEDDKIIFCDSDGKKVLEIEKSSVVEFTHIEGETYSVHVKPRHNQTFVLDFQLL